MTALVLIHGGNDFIRKHADAIPAANVRAMVAEAVEALLRRARAL